MACGSCARKSNKINIKREKTCSHCNRRLSKKSSYSSEVKSIVTTYVCVYKMCPEYGKPQ